MLGVRRKRGAEVVSFSLFIQKVYPKMSESFSKAIQAKVCRDSKIVVDIKYANRINYSKYRLGKLQYTSSFEPQTYTQVA